MKVSVLCCECVMVGRRADKVTNRQKSTKIPVYRRARNACNTSDTARKYRYIGIPDRCTSLNTHSQLTPGSVIWLCGNINQVLEISSQDRTRGNGYKVEKLRFRTYLGRYWFTNRVMNDWNRLGRHVVSGELIGSFKRRLDQSMDRDDRWVG